MDKIHWDANPSRKLCEIELFKHKGYKVRVCTKPYGKYSRGAEKALMDMAESMPECKTKDALIEILPGLLPPKVLKLQQAFDTLLTNDHLNRIVMTLAFNGMSSGEIVKIVNGLEGNYNFSFDQMDKFLFRYCNTRPDHGWTIQRQQEHEQFLRESYSLKSIFEFELDNGFGHLPQSEVLINLGIATKVQYMDYLMFEAMNKIRSSMDRLNMEKPLPLENTHSATMKHVHTVRALQLSTAKELSMLLNRFSKTRSDLQKIDEFDQAEFPQLRVHRLSEVGHKPNQKNQLRSSG